MGEHQYQYRGRGSRQIVEEAAPVQRQRPSMRQAVADRSAAIAVRTGLPGPDRGLTLTESDGLILIAPGKTTKMGWSDWPPHERIYRSMMVRAQSPHEVVSVGFPKFGNWGEADDDTATLTHALANDQDVWFTEKMDGSLIIRSVIDGEIVFRTRGTMDGGDFAGPVRQTAAAAYPALLDPTVEPNRSMLFEFVGPNHRIVVPYEQQDLVFLGAVDHQNFQITPPQEMMELAVDLQLNPVAVHELPRDPDELLANIEQWQGVEGVVARCNNGQTLVKMKAAEYLHRHRLRFSLTARVVREVCETRNVQTMEDFETFLQEQGADWEIATEAKPLVTTYLQARKQADADFARLEVQVETASKQYPDRGDFAREFAVQLPQGERPAAFKILQGQTGEAQQILRRHQLDAAFAAAVDADETAATDNS